MSDSPPTNTTIIQPHRELAFISQIFPVNAAAMTVLLRQVGADAFALYWAVLLEIIQANQPLIELPNRRLELMTGMGTHRVRAAQAALADIGAFKLELGQPNVNKHSRKPNRYELNPDFTLTIPTGQIPKAIIGGNNNVTKPDQPKLQNADMFANEFNIPLETVLAQAKAWLGRPSATLAIIDEALTSTISARYNANGDPTSISKPLSYVEAVIDDLIQQTTNPNPKKKKRKNQPARQGPEDSLAPSQADIEAAFEARMAADAKVSDDERVWNAALAALKIQTSDATFTAVFQNSTMHRIEDNNTCEITPVSDTAAEWMEAKWLTKISDVITSVLRLDKASPPLVIKIKYSQRE